MNNIKFREKAASRKFVTMIIILFFSSAMLLLPTAVSLIAKVKLAALLTGGEYVSLVLGCFGIYSGANVFQKKIEQDNNVEIGEGE